MRIFQILLIMLTLNVTGSVLAGDTRAQTGTKDANPGLTIAGDRIVGAPLVATFEMGDYTVPEGMYASINIDVEKRPEGKSQKSKQDTPIRAFSSRCRAPTS